MSSIREVARLAGVSPATVSRTFRTPHLINEDTRQRVLEASHRLHYKPNRRTPEKVAKVETGPERFPADVLAFQRVGLIYFAADMQDSAQKNVFYAPVMTGAMAEAESLGFHLLVHNTNRYTLSTELPKMIQERAVEGLLLVGTADARMVETFSRFIPHIVLVDNRIESSVYESVTSDGFGGAYEATRYLLRHGHRRIGFYLAESHVPTFQSRLYGYQCALLEAGICPTESLIIRGEVNADIRLGRLREVLSRADRPTALLTANDHYAMELLQECRGFRIRVPDDLSVIGFDDIPFCEYTDPPLTTLRVNKEAMGRLALRRLHAHFVAETTGQPMPPIRYEVPVSLVERQSCRSLSSPEIALFD